MTERCTDGSSSRSLGKGFGNFSEENQNYRGKLMSLLKEMLVLPLRLHDPISGLEMINLDRIMKILAMQLHLVH